MSRIAGDATISQMKNTMWASVLISLLNESSTRGFYHGRLGGRGAERIADITGVLLHALQAFYEGARLRVEGSPVFDNLIAAICQFKS